jgi:hypothetical protein
VASSPASLSNTRSVVATTCLFRLCTTEVAGWESQSAKSSSFQLEFNAREIQRNVGVVWFHSVCPASTCFSCLTFVARTQFKQVQPARIVDKLISFYMDWVVPGRGVGESNWYVCCFFGRHTLIGSLDSSISLRALPFSQMQVDAQSSLDRANGRSDTNRNRRSSQPARLGSILPRNPS